ncbi:homoserine dehydrogenase [Pseudactinotalea sp. Z1732]|uniref:homoserine dehydrogenase n=1 Tax=Micrococcales TaxID=85006 RepID=UPI003C7972DD
MDTIASEPVLRVAVLGCGTVGTEVIRGLRTQAEELAARSGTRMEISAIIVRDTTLARDPVVPTELLGTDARAAVESADLVVELMGGIEPARSLIVAALRRGAGVVTANKALLATHGPELFEAADAAEADLFFEAAVAGAVPVVRGVRESLAGDSISRIVGIVNGTTNYILDQMSTAGVDFDEALAQAKALGYAEADPTADVDGLDAAAKTAILASLAFHSRIHLDDVAVSGIRDITPSDIAAAKHSGHVLKLLAIAEQRQDETARGVAVRVHPALIPLDHPLANVREAYNAVLVQAEGAGTLMFYGAGAGGAPTASAVLGDLVAAARHRSTGGRAPAESDYAALRSLPAEYVQTRYQVRLEVRDRPGVLATLATTVSEQHVSVETVRQTATEEGQATLVLITHLADERALQAMIEAVDRLEDVLRISSVLRVEGH